jgi:hypothetical protein
MIVTRFADVALPKPHLEWQSTALARSRSQVMRCRGSCAADGARRSGRGTPCEAPRYRDGWHR